MTLEQEMQQDRLHTLIENMGSGMILIDSRGYINLVNRSYKETFHVTDEEYLDRLYYESFHHTEIIEPCGRNLYDRSESAQTNVIATWN